MSQKSTKHKKIIFESSPSLKELAKHPTKISFNGSDVNQSKQSNEISYLQPEILPLEVMKKLLKMRGASEVILNTEDGARSFIIKLFYKHITPKPQREYKINRLGKILLKMRCRREKGKDKNEWESMVLAETSKISGVKSSVSSCSAKLSSSLSSSCDRLKPLPSSCINLERKKIKLGSSSSTSLIKRNLVTEEHHEIKSIKKITLDSHESGRKLSSSSSTSPIKRNLVSEDENHEIKPIKILALDSHVSGRKIKLKINNDVICPKGKEKLKDSSKSKVTAGSPVKEPLIEIKEKVKTSSSVKRESDTAVPNPKREKTSIAWP